MTLPDTGPERPGGMASDTREMGEHDRLGTEVGGPRGHLLLLIAALIAIGVMAYLLLR